MVDLSDIDFEAKCKERIKSLQQQLELYLKIKKIIPDVTATWKVGCLNPHNDYTQVTFYSESVNRDFDEISFGGRGCCWSDDSDNPYYARSIKVIDGVRIRGSKKTEIGSRSGYYSGIDPDIVWEKKILEVNSIKAIPMIEKELENNPYELKNDNDFYE